jgi:hypothetical protein
MSSSSTRLPTAEGHGSVQSAQLHLDHHNRIKETHMSVTIEKSSVTTAVRPFTSRSPPRRSWRHCARVTAAGIVASFLTQPSGRPR